MKSWPRPDFRLPPWRPPLLWLSLTYKYNVYVAFSFFFSHCFLVLTTLPFTFLIGGRFLSSLKTISLCSLKCQGVIQLQTPGARVSVPWIDTTRLPFVRRRIKITWPHKCHSSHTLLCLFTQLVSVLCQSLASPLGLCVHLNDKWFLIKSGICITFTSRLK